MDAMPMPGGGMMSMVWMPMCGQTWIGAAASFLGMWTVMMVAMMLPSLAPALWRYGRRVGGEPGRAGEVPPVLLMALVAAGYMLAWALLGAAVYPLGATIVALTMRHPTLARVAPIATGLIVVLAGSLQLTRWKARQLACARHDRRRESPECGCPAPENAITAWRAGLRLGLHCTGCCAGLTAALLVTGLMNGPAMLAATVAINLERLAPAGERVARAIGVVVIGAGLALIAQATGLH